MKMKNLYLYVTPGTEKHFIDLDVYMYVRYSKYISTSIEWVECSCPHEPCKYAMTLSWDLL